MTAYRPVVPSRTGRYAVIGCKLKQNANERCNSCESLAGLVLGFIARFILLVIAPLRLEVKRGKTKVGGVEKLSGRYCTGGGRVVQVRREVECSYRRVGETTAGVRR